MIAALRGDRVTPPFRVSLSPRCRFRWDDVGEARSDRRGKGASPECSIRNKPPRRPERDIPTTGAGARCDGSCSLARGRRFAGSARLVAVTVVVIGFGPRRVRDSGPQEQPKESGEAGRPDDKYDGDPRIEIHQLHTSFGAPDWLRAAPPDGVTAEPACVQSRRFTILVCTLLPSVDEPVPLANGEAPPSFVGIKVSLAAAPPSQVRAFRPFGMGSRHAVKWVDTPIASMSRRRHLCR